MKRGRGGPRRGNWLVRIARGLRPDRNPLRRTNDRVETFLLAGSIVAALAAAPFAVPAAAAASHDAAASARAEQLATRDQVKAFLLQRAADGGDGYPQDSRVLVQASWLAPDGTHRSGQVTASAGAAKGSSVLVWTDPAGHLTGPPLGSRQIAGQADLAAIGAASGLALLVLCEAVILRRTLDRRRLAAWEADWEVTAPMWNRQRW